MSERERGALGHAGGREIDAGLVMAGEKSFQVFQCERPEPDDGGRSDPLPRRVDFLARNDQARAPLLAVQKGRRLCVEAIDGKGHDRLRRRPDRDRPARAKFGERALHRDEPGVAEGL